MKFSSENKEKIVSVMRLEAGGNDCEAGPRGYLSIWFVVLNNGEVNIFSNWWGRESKVNQSKVTSRKVYWNIVKNLEQIKRKKAIEIVNNNAVSTAVTAFFISYYDKNQSYQLIYKEAIWDKKIKNEDYMVAKSIVNQIEKLSGFVK